MFIHRSSFRKKFFERYKIFKFCIAACFRGFFQLCRNCRTRPVSITNVHQNCNALRYARPGALHRERSGVALLVALILVTLIMLFAVSVNLVVMSSVRDSANVIKATQAHYAAEGALEKGLLANVNKGAGYSDDKPVDVAFGQSGIKGNYKITGQVPADSKYGADGYGIPAPGTGDAGTECDDLHPFTIGSFYYSITETPHYLTGAQHALLTADKQNLYTGSYDDINNPCNWGKLKVGESVAIPLYVTKKDPQNPNGPDIVLNPSDPGLNLSSLKIKLRTPCVKGEYCSPIGTRMQLDTVDGDPLFVCSQNNPVRCGDTIVSWQIVGSNIAGDKTYTLSPYNKMNKTSRFILNSELYELLINKTNKLGCIDCVLSQIDNGQDINGLNDKIINFLTDQGVFLRNGNEKINKPVLKLTIIHSLQADKFTTIPYLEYQVTANTNIAPTDSSQTITAEGYSGSFKQVLEVKQPQQSGVLEYVIQQ